MKLKNWLGLAVAGFGLLQWQRHHEQSNAVSIKNKVVLITGASSGIGRATAFVFAAQGAQLILVARRANLLAELQAELEQKFKVRVLSVPTDLAQAADMDNLIDKSVENFGRIDVLVNNAGMSMGGYLEEQDAESIHKMLEVNLYGAIRLIQKCLPLMKAQKSGHIVNVSSVSAYFAAPGLSPYAATKAGLNTLSDTLRRELLGENIYVSVVMPGWTDTPMIEKATPEEMKDAGMVSWAFPIESPEYVASNIVAAVRYRRERVFLGGFAAPIMSIISGISPKLVDVILSFLDKEKIMGITKRAG